MVFDQNENGINTSSILNKKNGKLNPIKLNGIYEFDMWVRNKAKFGKFGVLQDEEEQQGECGNRNCQEPFHWHQ